MAISILNDKFFRWVTKQPVAYPIITMEKQKLVESMMVRIWIDLVGTAVSPGTIKDVIGQNFPIYDKALIKDVMIEATTMSHSGEKLGGWVGCDLYGKACGWIAGCHCDRVIGGTLGEIHFDHESRIFQDLWIPCDDDEELYLAAHINNSGSAEAAEMGLNAYVHLFKAD